jgi:cell wall-associated NlpC family hydrolase
MERRQIGPRKAGHYPSCGAVAPITRLVGLSVLLPCLLLAACGRKDTRPAPPVAGPATRDWPVVAPNDPAAANAVLMRAISLVGTPYRYGGNTPEGGFDCSGLVNYVFRDMLDLRLPRTSRELAAYQGPRIEPHRLATADLVFFGSGGQVTHVGIYVGEGRFVHAPSTGGTVRLDHLDGSYWRRNYSGARRVLQ